MATAIFVSEEIPKHVVSPIEFINEYMGPAMSFINYTDMFVMRNILNGLPSALVLKFPSVIIQTPDIGRVPSPSSLSAQSFATHLK
jgi:hypothetical protein